MILLFWGVYRNFKAEYQENKQRRQVEDPGRKSKLFGLGWLIGTAMYWHDHDYRDHH